MFDTLIIKSMILYGGRYLYSILADPIEELVQDYSISKNEKYINVGILKTFL